MKERESGNVREREREEVLRERGREWEKGDIEREGESNSVCLLLSIKLFNDQTHTKISPNILYIENDFK